MSQADELERTLLLEEIEYELKEIRERVCSRWIDVMKMMEQQDVKVERVN